jgi:hypothetical protein
MKPLNRSQDDVPDSRLYVPHAEGWQARIKTGWEKEYCHSQNPGEDFYHLLVGGEVYLESGEEKLCLRCALRRGILTTDRLHWQRPSRPAPL